MRNNKIAGGFARNTEEVQIIARCTQSFRFFCDNYAIIINQGYAQPIPFKLFPFQVIAADCFQKYQYNVCLKPRQMGLSTLLQAYCLWVAIFQVNREIIVVSIKHATAKKFLTKIKGIYSALPDYLRVPISNGNTRDLGSATELKFANGSAITVMGSTQDAGRSDSLSLLIIDEAAFQRYAESMWGAAYSTLNNGGSAIIISTAYGMGNFFHTTWVNAVQGGKNGFNPIQLHYSMWPGHTEEWLAKQIKLQGEKRVAQEVKCEFLKSGDSVFNLSDIREIEDRLMETKPYAIRSIRVHGTEQPDSVYLYEAPIPGVKYFIGADIATGRSTDFTTFSLYRKNWSHTIMHGDAERVEVGCGKFKCDVIDAAEILMGYGFEYNNALIAAEINGAGEGTVAALQKGGYPNIYHSETIVKDPVTGDKVKKKMPGFLSTEDTRKVMVAEMDADISSDRTFIQNPFFVAQAYAFIYDNAGKPRALNKRSRAASSGMYEDQESDDRIDDSILAGCIANYVCRHTNDIYGSVLPVAGSLR